MVVADSRGVADSRQIAGVCVVSLCVNVEDSVVVRAKKFRTVVTEIGVAREASVAVGFVVVSFDELEIKGGLD